MRKIIFLFGLFILTLLSWKSSTYVDSSVEYDVDVEKSVVEYLGKKPLGAHNGGIPISAGSLTVEDGKIIKGNFAFDMTKVDCWDIKDKKKNNYFVSHLKSEDFFDVEKYPTAKFVITSTKSVANGKYTVSGTLTLKEIPKKVTFQADVKITQDKVTLNTKNYFYIDRTDWGVKYKSKSFFSNLKDKFINDEVGIKINIVARKRNVQKL